MIDKDWYWLTDQDTKEQNPDPEEMTPTEAMEANARLERMHSRWRWVIPPVVSNENLLMT